MIKLLYSGLEWFLPEQCALCRLKSRTGILCKSCALPGVVPTFGRCPLCFSQVGTGAPGACLSCRFLPASFGTQRFLWDYSDRAREVLRNIKYFPNRRLALLTCQHLSKFVPAIVAANDYDLFVPVPCTLQSFRRREFNLPELFASLVKRSITGTDLSNRECFLLKQKFKHRPQASLPAAQRLRNVKNCFAARLQMQGQRILLIDDVVTTGATVQAAYQTLRLAGAGRIDLISIARSSAWERYRHSVLSKSSIS